MIEPLVYACARPDQGRACWLQASSRLVEGTPRMPHIAFRLSRVPAGRKNSSVAFQVFSAEELGGWLSGCSSAVAGGGVKVGQEKAPDSDLGSGAVQSFRGIAANLFQAHSAIPLAITVDLLA
jgi:hypothetical protein